MKQLAFLPQLDSGIDLEGNGGSSIPVIVLEVAQISLRQ